MATWTKSTLAARVLEDLGVVGEGQSATGEQSNRVQEVIDSVYRRLRPKHLCPFALTAIPEWAQVPLRDVVAWKAAPRFGYAGARLQERMVAGRQGMIDLADGAAGNPEGGPIRSKFH